MIISVSVPRTVKSDKDGYEFLASLYPKVIGAGADEVYINFSECTDFNGNLASALGAILDRFVLMGLKVLLSTPSSKKVRRALSRNHFLRAWEISTAIEDRENYIEYQRFKSDGPSQEFKRYVDDGLLHKKHFPKHTAKVGAAITENIFEIFVNAITHGETQYAYSCGEYDEHNEVLEMTIVDCGQTIPGNVNTFFSSKGREELNHCEAIEWAFISGNTTKTETGGLGLAIIKEFIGLNDGEIQVVSGNGMVVYHGNNVERFLLLNSFPGTIVNMRFNFSDKKTYFLTSEKDDINFDDLL